MYLLNLTCTLQYMNSKADTFETGSDSMSQIFCKTSRNLVMLIDMNDQEAVSASQRGPISCTAHPHTLITSHTQTITHSYPHTLIPSHTQTITHSYPHTLITSHTYTLTHSNHHTLTPSHNILKKPKCYGGVTQSSEHISANSRPL